MAEFGVIIFMGFVCKNIVNVIKMTVGKEKLGAIKLVLSGAFGVLIAWLLFGSGVKLNIFAMISEKVQSSLGIALFSGGLVGLVGQDFYKLMKLTGMKIEEIKNKLPK
jgi:uncharacterized membrane protein